MHYYESAAYLAELKFLAENLGNAEKLKNKTFLLSGATGMIGSLLTDLVLYANAHLGWNSRVVALVRNPVKARNRFPGKGEAEGLLVLKADLSSPIPSAVIPASAGNINYIIHAASNTHPVQYATEPVSTILTNILGADNMLRLTRDLKAERFLFLSSVEIYGENRGDVEAFSENYCGYIDSNTLRAGYPEGKRAGETLCQAYARQYGIDFVIARLARAYGPTLQRSDTKAMSQFLWNALAGKAIVLKSAGTQQYSYIYAGDAVRGLLWLLTEGNCGEAYNLSGKASDVLLRDLAARIASMAGTELVFDLPDAVEAAGYSKATKAMLNADKLRNTGFSPLYNMETGLDRTLAVLKETL